MILTYSKRTLHIGTNPATIFFVGGVDVNSGWIAPGTKGPVFETVSGVLGSRPLAFAFEGNSFYLLVVAAPSDIKDGSLLETGIDGLQMLLVSTETVNSFREMSTQRPSFLQQWRRQYSCGVRPLGFQTCVKMCAERLWYATMTIESTAVA